MKKFDIVDSSELNYNRKLNRLWSRYSYRITFFKWVFPLVFFAFFGLFPGVLFYLVWLLIATLFWDHRDLWRFSPEIHIWFGVPGSGKTSMAALLSKYSRKLGYKVLSNFELDGAYRLQEEDLGTVDMSFGGRGCHVVYDEATVSGLDNRMHGQFAKSEKPRFFALHRHMNVRVDVFSQGYDIDKRVRDRASSSGLFCLKKFPIPGWLMYRRIKKVLIIDKESRQMIDGFKFSGLPRFVRSKSVWNSFNTLDTSQCPKLQKEWKLWN